VTGDGTNPVLDAIGRLAGYQAISLPEAFRVLLGDDGDPDLAPVARRRELCRLLDAHGYSERWVTLKGSGEAQLMWVRGPWPIDASALDGREVETYHSA
jgi:hypothetical protein